ncbi:MAG TPA: signal peptidase II [Longimicrobiaceae bacterium]
MSRGRDRLLAATVVALVAADWLSKIWVTRQLALGESRSLVEGWLYVVHRRNPGVAFSIFADLPEGWRLPILVGLSLVGVVVFARLVLSSGDMIIRAAATVVLAGALGNLGDRLLNGSVTDFMLVRYFPFVFNLADAAITVGGILLAVRLVLMDEALEPSPATRTP